MFDPQVEVLQPSSGSHEDHLGTIKITLEDGTVIHVLAYEGGASRYRNSRSDLVLTECYLGGDLKQRTILKLEPRAA